MEPVSASHRPMIPLAPDAGLRVQAITPEGVALLDVVGLIPERAGGRHVNFEAPVVEVDGQLYALDGLDVVGWRLPGEPD